MILSPLIDSQLCDISGAQAVVHHVASLRVLAGLASDSRAQQRSQLCPDLISGSYSDANILPAYLTHNLPVLVVPLPGKLGHLDLDSLRLPRLGHRSGSRTLRRPARRLARDLGARRFFGAVTVATAP